VKAAVKNGWGLYQIAPDQTSLEDVFIQLTYQNGAQDETKAPGEPTAA
jgi:ABC-2 type transport system ATP-binding protein